MLRLFCFVSLFLSASLLTPRLFRSRSGPSAVHYFHLHLTAKNRYSLCFLSLSLPAALPFGRVMTILLWLLLRHFRFSFFFHFVNWLPSCRCFLCVFFFSQPQTNQHTISYPHTTPHQTTHIILLACVRVMWMRVCANHLFCVVFVVVLLVLFYPVPFSFVSSVCVFRCFFIACVYFVVFLLVCVLLHVVRILHLPTPPICIRSLLSLLSLLSCLLFFSLYISHFAFFHFTFYHTVHTANQTASSFLLPTFLFVRASLFSFAICFFYSLALSDLSRL